jgi:hypothetical protein
MFILLNLINFKNFKINNNHSPIAYFLKPLNVSNLYRLSLNNQSKSNPCFVIKFGKLSLLKINIK